MLVGCGVFNTFIRIIYLLNFFLISIRILDLTSVGQKFLEITAKEDQTFLVLKSKLFLSAFLERNYTLHLKIDMA